MRIAKMTFEKHDIDGTLWTSEVTPTGTFTVKCVGPKTWEAIKGQLRIGGTTYPSSSAAKQACQRYFECMLEEWIELEPHETGGHDKIAEAVKKARGY